MRLCVFGGWRGKLRVLPEADVYVCVGDMLPLYPNAGRLDPREQVFRQARYVRQAEWHKIFPNRQAPVVLVRGDGDCVPYAAALGEQVCEIGTSATTYVIDGLVLGGYRGAPEKATPPGKTDSTLLKDALTFAAQRKLADSLPKNLDVLVTHAPPITVLDSGPASGSGSRLQGLYGLREYTAQALSSKRLLRLHCFGHWSPCFGYKREEAGGHDLTFVNAASGFHVVKLGDGGSWRWLSGNSWRS